MQGLNRQFKNSTEDFLRHTPIFESMRHMAHPPAQGVVEFDLEPYHGGARIGEFATRGTAATYRTRRIAAYWLPWQTQGTASIQLGGLAEYFFTSQLAGCQIRIVPAPARFGRTNHPQVMHIAGDSPRGPADPHGTNWRAAQATAALTPAQMGRSRALSSTGLGNLGYHGEGVNVVGFKRLGAWVFFGQQIDFDNETVTRVWRL
jgi:hypothetical protein